MSLTICKVETPADFKALLDFPWTVYKDDPNWVPLLKSMRRDMLDKKRNPAWEYMEGDYFLAKRGDQVVGTIAAFINRRHNEFHGENVGWFGAFDVLNDSEAAATLLNTAVEWVKAKGCDAILGPQTLTTHEEVGLLVEGFTPPVLLMPYHPTYYRDFIEAADFTKSMDLHSFYYDWDMLREDKLEDRFERITERIFKRSNLKIRSINRKNLRADFELFKEIYNKAWAENWGFVPMTEKELDALIEGLGMIFDPDLACFAEVDGEVVGFLLVVPDFNQVLHKAYPRPNVPEVFTLLKALWHWKIRPSITMVRTPLMGVVAEHRSKGFDLAMHYHVMKILRQKGYQSVDCGWILETNHDMEGVMRGFGMKQYKTHRLYQKLLTR